MFAMLGPISFRLITYFEGVTNKRAWDYAKHDVIEGKPRLQYMGEALEEVTIDLVFHVSYCNPEAELAKLRIAGTMRTALPFIYGSGHYVGMFVIKQIQSTTRQTDKRGGLVAVMAKVTLMEHGGLGGLLGAIISVVNNAARASGAGSNRQSTPAPTPPSGDPGAVPPSSIVRS